MPDVERVWAVEESLTDERFAEAKARVERMAGQALGTDRHLAPTDPLTYHRAKGRTADLVVVGRQGLLRTVPRVR